MLGLAFSGGKDSLACWYLTRHLNPVVFWVNTGKAYPETIEIINEVRADSSEFIEVNSDQEENILEYGIPSDLVPIANTATGMLFEGVSSVKIQSYLGCCIENITKPLMLAVKKRGITELIRGQRISESHKSVSKDGDLVDGILLSHPIENWSDTQVLEFIASKRILPKHFSIKHSSLDCYDCTAYVMHSADRIAWTRNRHPELYVKYEKRMSVLRAAVLPIAEALNG